MCGLLGIEPAPNDGRSEVTRLMRRAVEAGPPPRSN
jgi:hypothetical protein